MEGADIRILVALEDDYRAYREVIAASIRILRPHAEVETAVLEALEEELERFDPELVISSGHKEIGPGGKPAWIELSLEATLLTKISVGGRYSERSNPTLETLLEVIDELE